MTRPTLDDWGLELAATISQRGTCDRRKVGCVLMNKRGHILATGYNGPASGAPHCYDPKPNDEASLVCRGNLFTTGEGLHVCQAVHAEQNALMQCADVSQIYTCYVTVSPCVSCVKMLLNTGCQRIVFSEAYAHDNPASLWWIALKGRGTWLKL